MTLATRPAVGPEFQRALAENARYADQFDRSSLPLPPGRKLAVLACMDARLTVEDVLALRTGDAHIIRNAGGLATDDAIRSLVISQNLLGTEEVIVIEHTGCGMLTFQDEDVRRKLAQETGQDLDIAFLAFPELESNLREQSPDPRASVAQGRADPRRDLRRGVRPAHAGGLTRHPSGAQRGPCDSLAGPRHPPLPSPGDGGGRSAATATDGRRHRAIAVAARRQPVRAGRDPVGGPGRGDPRASLRILRDIGVEVLGARGARPLRAPDARARSTARDGRPRPPGPGAASRSWSRWRRGASSCTPGTPSGHPARRRPHLVFGAVGGPAFVTDLDRGRRAGNAADFVRLRPGDRHPRRHPPGGRRTARADRPAGRDPAPRHVPDAGHAARQDVAVPRRSGRRSSTTPSRSPRSPAGVDRETLVREPSLMTIINTNSPLRLDGPMSDGLIEMATWGQPVVATPFTLAGAMTPGDARRRARPAERRGAVLHRARPAGPARGADGLRRRSPRTSTCAPGRRRSARRSTSRRRSRPGSWPAATGCRGGSSNATASNVVDAQAAYESEMAVWGAVMGGVNLLYQGAGWLEGGLTASYEKLIVDAELLQMMAEVLTADRRVDEATLGRRRDRGGRPGRPLLRHRRTPSSATRPRSTGRCCRTGGTSRRGRRTAPGPPRSGRTGSGSSSSPSARRRRSTRPPPKRSTPSSTGASARSPAGREGTPLRALRIASCASDARCDEEGPLRPGMKGRRSSSAASGTSFDEGTASGKARLGRARRRTPHPMHDGRGRSAAPPRHVRSGNEMAASIRSKGAKRSRAGLPGFLTPVRRESRRDYRRW